MKFSAYLLTSALLLATPAMAQDLSQQYPQSEPAYPAAADYYASQGTYTGDPAPVTNAPAIQPRAGNNNLSANDFILSAGAAVVTDYSNRGVSRSDGPALQGHARVEYQGAYAGVAASTVDLNTDPDADIELNPFIGYHSQFDAIDYDARLAYTGYPGGDNDDEAYWEFILTGGYDFSVFYGSLTWALSPDYINDSDVTLYYGADVAAPLPIIGGMDLTANAHLGFQFVGDNDKYIDDNAMDWSLGLAYKMPDYGIDLGLSYVDTNLDDDQCAEDCSGRVLLSAGKTFGW